MPEQSVATAQPVPPFSPVAMRRPRRALAILGVLMSLGPLATDFYLPAIPAMARELAAVHGDLEFTVSGYLLGFSLGQLFWGPVSDRVGRRGPIACGLLLFIVGSAGCALAHSVAAVIGWRLLQALGASAGIVIARAMIQDLFDGHRAAQTLSLLIIFVAVAPMIAPLAGGGVLALGTWRWIFWLSSLCGIMTLSVIYTLPETLPAERRDEHAVRHAVSRYFALVVDREILAYAGVGGFFYAGVFAYIAGTPFAFISYYHVSPALYGVLFGAGIVGLMAANAANSQLVRRFGSTKLLQIGGFVVAFAGLAAAGVTWANVGGLVALAAALFLFVSMNGLIVANSLSGALAAWPHRAGTVSALIGALHYGSGIVGSGLVGMLADGTTRPLGLTMALAGIGCLACTRLLGAPTRAVACHDTPSC